MSRTLSYIDRKANKDHKCDFCGGTIKKGTIYECKPMYDTDNEENLFIDDLLKFHKSEQMYNKETVIHIIKQVLMYNKNKP